MPISPTVKAYCDEKKVDPDLVEGTGSNGAVTKADVDAVVVNRGAVKVPEVAPNIASTELQDRHMEWLERAARMAGRTIEVHLEWIVRQAYAQDHSKAGTAGLAGATGPQGSFNPASGGFG